MLLWVHVIIVPIGDLINIINIIMIKVVIMMIIIEIAKLQQTKPSFINVFLLKTSAVVGVFFD